MSSFVARFAPMSSAKALTSASACFSSKPASRSRRDAFSVSNATMPVSYALARRPATPAPRQRAKTRRSASDTSGR